ncbi:SAM-dependent methyltransferase [Catenulispora sp. MAP12-49]|uniref:class I SAM-dependent methyltransferase n=1 Tax=unclassified Catenulispora TaxID=414885 RepID=UPI003512D55D
MPEQPRDPSDEPVQRPTEPAAPTVPSPEPHQPPSPTQPAGSAISASFGEDPARYDRARPGYPRALIDRVVAGRPARTVLDVGCGTGIVARQLQAAGCVVTGVEPDARMAAFAAGRGVGVEVATFEDWDPAARLFDVLTAGMTWHWVDAEAGAEQAARVLRPGGRIALFWNAFQVPPQLAEAFAEVYAELLPEHPMYQHGVRAGKEVYAPLLAGTADRLREAGFEQVEHWRDEWKRTYTRAEWLDLFPTFGGHALLPRTTVAALQEAIGAEVDAVGGEFEVEYATVTVAALRAPRE